MTTTGERLAGPHDFDCEVTFWRQRGIDGEMKPECDCGTDECVREIDAMERVVEAARDGIGREPDGTWCFQPHKYAEDVAEALVALDALRAGGEEGT